MAKHAVARKRLSRMMLVAAPLAMLGVAIHPARAVDGGVLGYCQLPPLPVYCSVDADCSHFGAACDESPATLAANCNSGVCSCAAIYGSDGGVADLGTGDAAVDAGGSGYATLPIRGGGTTYPLRSGCSYLPGAALE